MFFTQAVDSDDGGGRRRAVGQEASNNLMPRRCPVDVLGRDRPLVENGCAGSAGRAMKQKEVIPNVFALGVGVKAEKSATPAVDGSAIELEKVAIHGRSADESTTQAPPNPADQAEKTVATEIIDGNAAIGSSGSCHGAFS